MSFVQAGLLAGIGLIAVPIVLHLIMRRQPRRVEFPALRFLKARRDANRRRLKLRHLLLLALRCAAIGLLAAALAQPRLRGSGGASVSSGPVAAAFIFDTAPRMEYRRENQTNLAAAQGLGAWLLGRFPAASQVAIVDGHTPRAAFAVDQGAAAERIKRLKTSTTSRPLPELVASALDLLETAASANRAIYLFTDLSESAWDEAARGTLAARLADHPDIALQLIDVGAEQPDNLALLEMRLGQETLSARTPLTVTATASRIGLPEERAIELLLGNAEGKLEPRASQAVKFDEREAATCELSVANLAAGFYQGAVHIVGDDPLASDNTRYFTVQVRDAWQVLLVAERREQTIFLEEAISPEAFRKSGQARFECAVATPRELSENPLGEYGAVCLLDPPPLGDNVWEQIFHYVDAGGRLVIYLGAAAATEASAEKFRSEPAKRLLPALPERQSIAETWLAPRPLDHPSLRRFADLGDGVPWPAFPVLRYWQLGGWAKGTQLVVPFANGDPAIVERPVGRGRVVLWTTPVSEPANIAGKSPWNFLATGIEPWPFVMLANESLLELLDSGEERLNYVAGQTAQVPLPGVDRPTQVLLTTPGGASLRLAADPRNPRLSIAATAEVGNYGVAAGGGANRLARGFSVNLADRESLLRRVGAEQLDALLGKGRYRLAREQAAILRGEGEGRAGRELFPFLIVACIAALAIEGLLANRFYDQRTERADRSKKFSWPKILRSLLPRTPA